MTRSQRSVLLSVLTLVLALALVAGGTYALFSDTVSLKNHLEAGTLKITLTRTELRGKVLNNTTGYLDDLKVTDDVPFTDPTGKNVFDVTDNTLIVPGCYYEADLEVKNESSVAFGYWLEIKFDDSADLELADQLTVTVVTDAGTEDDPLSASAGLIGSETAPVAKVAKGTAATFTVRVDFENLANDVNNDAKGQKVNFDLIVHAVQLTEAP